MNEAEFTMDPGVAAIVGVAAGVDGELGQRIAFLLEIDRLKSVIRRSDLVDGSRRENTAEHSWHLALAAVVLAGHANEPVDLARVVTMLLVHDLVEIDAGDTYVYDTGAAAETKTAREREAAERIFGLLPGSEGGALRALWEEFEARESADARFAYAMDRLQPVLLNAANQGASWRAHGIAAHQVRQVNDPIRHGSADLHAVVQGLITHVAELGWLAT